MRSIFNFKLFTGITTLRRFSGGSPWVLFLILLLSLSCQSPRSHEVIESQHTGVTDLIPPGENANQAVPEPDSSNPDPSGSPTEGLPSSGESSDSVRVSMNKAVLEAINEMPVGGGYSLGADAGKALLKATQWTGETLNVIPKNAQPSYCSGATYLVLLKALQKTNPELFNNSKIAPLFALKGQADGVGVYGRWNANGPGTARLVYELNLGTNFTDWSSARPGDFMKIFWDLNIGSKEKGHSVVFLGTEVRGGTEYVSFWSSNQPGGFGKKTVEKSRVKRAIFSRILNSDRWMSAEKLPNKDQFLADMLKRPSTIQEVQQMTGLSELPKQ